MCRKGEKTEISERKEGFLREAGLNGAFGHHGLGGKGVLAQIAKEGVNREVRAVSRQVIGGGGWEEGRSPFKRGGRRWTMKNSSVRGERGGSLGLGWAVIGGESINGVIG